MGSEWGREPREFHEQWAASALIPAIQFSRILTGGIKGGH